SLRILHQTEPNPRTWVTGGLTGRPGLLEWRISLSGKPVPTFPGYALSWSPQTVARTVMPLYYKIPAYVGNTLLLGAGLILLFQEMPVMGVGLSALAGLNLYLVRKLDVFSREEVWLAAELVKERLRDELEKARAKHH